eukprot:scaffold95085_cov57-Phaeocystis_antarctica.AAC.2
MRPCPAACAGCAPSRPRRTAPSCHCAQRHAAARRGASGERRAGRRGAGESASSEHASTSIGVPTARATAAFAFSHPNDAWSTTTR